MKWMAPVLPYVQDVGMAMAVMLLALVVTVPLRRRFRRPEFGDGGASPGGMAGWAGAVVSHLGFAVVVLVVSVPLVVALNQGIAQADWSARHLAWLSYWSLYALLRLIEGVFVETTVRLRGRCPLSALSRNLLRGALMLGVAFLLIKYQLGYNINVLLTSTAIVTGIIGFAMQGVLGNLLAGMSLHATRSLTVGEWIQVEDMIGQVIEVNWRETRLKTNGGHIIIVPNSKLADATMRNFSTPTPLRRHDVPVAASYGDAPGDVIAALLEAADSIPQVEKTPPPDAYVTAFRDFGIEYILRFWSRSYPTRTRIDGEVMRMIWYKFNRRGIEIPFPMSGRVLDNFMQAVHDQRFEKPLPSAIARNADDLLRSDLCTRMLVDANGQCLIDRAALLPLARDVRRLRYTAGEILFRQGEGGDAFYVLVQGSVAGRIAKADATKDVEFSLAPGAVFGEMSLLTGLPRTATMIASSHCEVLEMTSSDFSRLLALHERIPHVLSDLAAARAAQNQEAFEQLRQAAGATPQLAREGILGRLLRMIGRH